LSGLQDRSDPLPHEPRSIVVSEYIGGDVEFCFFRREAREVFLCGDFNGWHETSLPMAQAGGGWWKCRLRLAPGCYQFKYRADGEWYLDYAAFGIERGPRGVWNSVVVVGAGLRDAEPQRTPVAHKTTPIQPPKAVSASPVGSFQPFAEPTRSGWGRSAASECVRHDDGYEPGFPGITGRHGE
jgi:1,4-alpha-glucan branching enzyme